MAAIKFSKQYVDPNPNEVDYWIDLTSNPYGGKIKYNNGIDWVDLIGSNGNAVDFDNYFNKDQINEMLANKASVNSVESKVDDTEIADIIKNIEIKDRGNSGVELVLLKYDDTTIGVTMPIASSTTSGVVTSDDFKNLVKQYKLQEFYTEMYEKLADIRNSYQPKLKAGKNITIDKTTNTIHAIGKVSTEWKDLINVPDFKLVATSGDYNDLINKPDETIQDIKSTLNKEIQDRKDAVTTEINDRINAVKTEETRAIVRENELSTRIDNHFAITDALIESKADKSDTYTKNQIDQKLSGVYRIKGSCSFEQLPLTGNTAGDVYIITNAFTLNGVEYSAGTNVVYTDNGWVALSDMFDMTELENAIQNVSINLTNEIVRATEAEQLNATDITNIDNRLKNAEESLNTINGDELTTGSIAKVIKDTKDHTDSSVTTEKNRAIEAENKIASDLSTAKTDIYNQISSINETVSTEISAREASDTTISTNLTNEINRATTRENKIEQDCIASVQGLQSNVNDVNTSLTNKINIVDGKLVNYLPLSGGTLKGKTSISARLSLVNGSYLEFVDKNESIRLFGVYPNNNDLSYYDGVWHKVWHEGNFTPSDYLLLSGGTISGTHGALTIHRTNEKSSLIKYSNSSGDLGHLGFNSSKEPIVYKGTDTNEQYKIWHTGNDGEDSGLNADLLDGVQLNELFTSLSSGQTNNVSITIGGVTKNLTLLYASYAKNITVVWNNPASGTYDLNNFFGGYVRHYGSGGSLSNAPSGFGNGAVLALTNGAKGLSGQLAWNIVHNSTTNVTNKLWWRAADNPNGFTYSQWKQIAFTDSNVASATKLETARTIWGQSFDGTNDVDGRFTMTSENGLPFKISWMGTENTVLMWSWANNNGFGDLCIGAGKDTPAKALYFSGANGYWGIGTVTPEYKLHVVGTSHINGAASFNSSVTLKGTSSTTARIIMSRSSYNYINYPTDGSLCLGTSNSSASTQLFIDGATGNVGIGTVEPSVKLSVKGNSQLRGTVYVTNLEATTIGANSGKIKFNSIHPTNTDKDKLRSPYIQAIYQGNYSRKRLSIFQSDATNYTDDFVEVFTVLPNGNVGIGTTKPLCKLDVNGNVSGDFVDWYGVSWSENSSDPTCTRIGNMAMHKSLPILSAMKGYYISNINDRTPEIIIPMDENWTNVKYDISTNDSTNIGQLPAGNDMVKIPEFWYIDDYEPSTKTHNLKISQTAKAGWCHHKEAYVGAYEGFTQGNLYLSIKGQIPTVDLTRKLIRPLARSNGYQGEYKWNIYTYEEHRAICHLFLVEYATRNSQLEVNTALTADGFKQGGLGSGCTTGVMNNEYSFIPTGTTNSLGNGSGQVAYTASNGTTYYANRYRGIENPFGHIWKHVDDIVNVYDADTTYKTVYKCNKPEHFANNKTDKYKPLCSFPGGAKMQGLSKEIKATINCDFFKYSIGGSESTYWCDYNYDNDDTSEHCLLIGGASGSISPAGLFCFYLRNGVDYSAVSIGSRLTYLPWAE